MTFGKRLKLCTRVKHPKKLENDHPNHQSYSIQSPLNGHSDIAKGYSDILQPY